MLPYWLFFGLFVPGTLLSVHDPRQVKHVGTLAVAWLAIVLMIGLRWEIGPDWFAYAGWWKRAGRLPLGIFLRGPGVDPGFYSLMWCFRQVTGALWVFNLFVAAIFASGLVSFARNQRNPWLALIIAVPYLVIVLGMSGERQATAIGFVFFALKAFRERRPLKFLGWMMLAASFHASSIFLVPLAGLSFARTRFEALVLIGLTAVAAFVVVTPAFDMYSQRYFARTIQSSGTPFRIAMTVIPSLLYLGYRKRFPGNPHEHFFWRNLSVVGLFSIPLYFAISSSTALDRILLYLFPLQIYVLAAVPDILGARRGRILINSAIIGYLAVQLFIFLNFGLNKYPYLPYKTIFSLYA